MANFKAPLPPVEKAVCMKKIIAACIILGAMACRTQPDNVLYKSEEFTLYTDAVQQGKYTAQVISPTEIRSNYQSTASQTYSRLIKFKVSINEKDNEMPAGQDHWVLIGEEHESGIKTFGQTDGPLPAQAPGYLPPNYEYTFRINMAPVLRQFAEKGYYEAFDGSKVAKADFKGFYLAGGSEPLTWDFVNLDEQGLRLTDDDNDSVYSLKLILNPLSAADTAAKTWKLSKDLRNKPQYKSDQPIVDALFNLSLEEALKNIEPDTTFRTGAKWGGVWTRDISYSILLAFAYHEPEVAKISLMKKVKRRRIVQDTGSGGAWPVSSDRTTWALAAWEIYKATGDTAWLRNAFEIISNTVADDAKVIGLTESGMYSGESSFLDWREQTYPKWMDNKDIYASENLGTNVVHYQSHIILAEMAKALGQDGAGYAATALQIREAINKQLWLPEQGYYAQYLYGRFGQTASPRFEALGEALAVLFGVTDAEKAKSIFAKSPLTPFGVTCIYPQIPGIPPYHNNGIWPFVQSYWNLAAAKAGNEQALNHGLAAIYRAAALFLTNYENMVAETGDYVGTEINSDRMLWSMAGNLAMVHRVFMGMQFEPNGIRFAPAVPAAYKGSKTLSNFRYRQAVLSITVAGTGNVIESISMDGQPLPDAFLPATTSGAHSIVIKMNNKPFDKDGIKLTTNRYSLPEPVLLSTDNNTLRWQPVKGARHYLIYRNGVARHQTTDTVFRFADTAPTEFKIAAVDKEGYTSFTCEPVMVNTQARLTVEAEQGAAAASLGYVNYSGSGYVALTSSSNTRYKISINVAEAGNYWLDVRYSNGSGPWNTDNKCALRSLYINGAYSGSLVLPQRGKDEWSDWGYSNARMVTLQAGANTLELVLEPWNTNMNVDVNTAMLDHWRLIRVPGK